MRLRSDSPRWLFIVLVFGSALSVFPSKAQGPQGDPSHPEIHSVPEWQTAAGGKLQFEVASIRLSEPGTFIPPNFGLNIGNEAIPPGGNFTADFPLDVYIEFAYKIMPTEEQREAILSRLPKWVKEDHFVIRAKAPGEATKDQMRLMMQSLLAERFKLATHLERRTLPALGLVLLKPGKLGPRLRPHSEGLACDARWMSPADRSSPSVPPGGFLPTCGTIQAIDGRDHTVILGARGVPLLNLASYLPSAQELARPIVDQTGLSGTFDFSLNWTPESKSALSSLAGSQPEEGGVNLLEALQDQLGLNLRPKRLPIEILVIDHVEPPTPN